MSCSLPPKVDKLSTFKFGKLCVRIEIKELNTDLESISLMIEFMGEQQSQTAKNGQTIEYDIFTSLWHFNQYLQDAQNIKIHLLRNNTNIGYALVFLPLFLEVNINKQTRNLINEYSHEFSIFETTSKVNNLKNIGKINVRIATQFNDIYSQIAAGIIKINSNKDRIIQQKVRQTVRKDTPNNQIISYVFDQKHQTKKIEDQIDKMVADLQSKYYDSSKYQDDYRENTNRQNFDPQKPQQLHKRIEPYFQISQYNLNKQNLTTQPSSKLSYQQNLPYGYFNIETNRSKNEFKELKNTKYQSKILKLQVFELSVGPNFNSETLFNMSEFKLVVKFPNQQKAGFLGKKNGEIINFSNHFELEVEQKLDVNSGVKKYFNSQIQEIKFILLDKSENYQLAIGKFDLDRFRQVDGRGVFVVNLNKKTSDFKQKITVSISKLKAIQPQNLHILNLRIGLNMESLLKDKIYQLLLNIQKVNINNLNEDIKVNLRYKLIQTQENIAVETKNKQDCKHMMIIPFLLQNLIKQKTNKLLIQVWADNKLHGLVQLELNKIQKMLIQQNGRINQNILIASLYPLYLYDGPQNIRELGTNKNNGHLLLGLCFGNVKQINRLISEKNIKQNKPTASLQSQQKWILPYDQKLGVFLKQKKVTKQMDVQVQIQKSICLAEQQFESSHISENCSDFQIQSIRQINVIPQTIQQKPKQLKVIKGISITKKYIFQIQQLLKEVIQINQNFVNNLKLKTKPYLLFSFIDKNDLIDCIHNEGICEISAKKILQILPSHDSNMVCITPLFDYFLSIQYTKSISQNLISQQQLADFMIAKYIQNRSQNQIQKAYIIDKEDVKEKFYELKYELNLREVEVFWNRYFKQLEITCLAKWKLLFMKVKQVLENLKQQQMHQNQQNRQIVEQIYEISRQIDIVTNKKLIITLTSYQNCIESAKCLLNINIADSEVKFTILKKQIVFRKDQSKQLLLDQDFQREEFYGQNAKVQLYVSQMFISECLISIQNLAFDEIEGTYALKTKSKQFCGLLHFIIMYVH